jgi:hypothetical protein
MLAELSPSELGMWAAMWTIDPWGKERDELGFGVVASTIANVNRDSKKKATPFVPKDFMPYLLSDQSARNKDVAKRIREVMGAKKKNARSNKN